MNAFQDIGHWGSNLLGQAQVQLAPAAAAAACIAAKSLQQGTDFVKHSAKAVRSSLKENLGGFSGGATHTFRDPGGGGLRSVTEVAHIAEGGFGEVVRVSENNSGKQYALKKIRCAEGTQIASSLEAAEMEGKILSTIAAHPNIIRCYGYSVDSHPGGGNTVKLLLELCAGGHLLDFMDSRQGKLSAREIVEPFMQIVDAVRHLHAQRPAIQHRDLKVENVLQGVDGKWKLCDFGSCSTERVPAVELSRSRLLQLQDEIDKTVTMLYRPPEMADIELNFRKGYEINEQVDIWMLGCILYTLAFYRHPFQDNATAMAITNAKYFIPKDHAMARSAKLVGLVHWLLAADPKDRPTAARLLEVLLNISKVPYPELFASMPASVQEKIQRLRALFTARKDVEPPTSLDANGKATVRAGAPAPRLAAQADGARVGQAAGRAPGGGAQEFDLRFALASEQSAQQAGGVAATRTVPASASQREPEDLMSLGSPRRGAAPTPAASTPESGFSDLLGFSEPFEAFEPSAQSRPAARATSQAPVAGTGVPAGAFWDSFGEAPATPAHPAGDLLFGEATPSVPAPWPANAGGGAHQASRGAAFDPLVGGGGFDDFADFSSAPPPPAPATTGAIANGQANLLDLF